MRTEGAILPADLLQRVVARDSALDGLTPAAYPPGRRREAQRSDQPLVEPARRCLVGVSIRSGQASENDAATSATREKWLLPLFQELGYGRLIAAKPVEIDGKSYAVSHNWHHALIHLIGFRVDLDRRQPGTTGASRTSPHSLVQELLNQSDDHLWGFLSNGRGLRILRDNASLTRQAFVEFDLEAMMAGEVYADFALLWLLCHQSRVETERPAECWLEQWSKAAQEQGTRALDQLRDGVESAIVALGRGFLSYPGNAALRGQTACRHIGCAGLLSPDPAARLSAALPVRGRRPRPAARPRRRPGEPASATRNTTPPTGCGGSPSAGGVRRMSTSTAACGSSWRSSGRTRVAPSSVFPRWGASSGRAQAVADLAGCDLANADLLDAIRALAFTIEGRTRPRD